MKQYFYPAIFHDAEEGGYWVSFPDFPECFTQGESMEEAYRMSVEALGSAISERVDTKEKLPTASMPDKIKNGEHVVIIQFDLNEYNRKHNARAVKKTVSIPEWLNEKAVENNINFSQVLKEALITKLG